MQRWVNFQLQLTENIIDASKSQVNAVTSVITSVYKIKAVSESNKSSIDHLSELLSGYEFSDENNKVLSLTGDTEIKEN